MLHPDVIRLPISFMTFYCILTAYCLTIGERGSLRQWLALNKKRWYKYREQINCLGKLKNVPDKEGEEW
jgi:hypothetical protein